VLTIKRGVAIFAKACFGHTAEEVEKQLLAAGLSNLTVELDDYLLIYGEI
jgi:hypothetical protein